MSQSSIIWDKLIKCKEEIINIFDANGTEGFDTVGFDNTTSQSTTLDYWTINRASQDLNAWSRANRWVHIDAIKATEKKLNINKIIKNFFITLML